MSQINEKDGNNTWNGPQIATDPPCFPDLPPEIVSVLQTEMLARKKISNVEEVIAEIET